MEKRKLTNFIEKYHLAGNANSVGLDVNDQTLSCEFITDDQNVVGRVTMEDFDIENVRLGVYNTSSNRRSFLLHTPSEGTIVFRLSPTGSGGTSFLKLAVQN